MAKTISAMKHIEVYADWKDLVAPHFTGILQVVRIRGKEIFSFTYDNLWLESGQPFMLDPTLSMYSGPQYIRDEIFFLGYLWTLLPIVGGKF